MKRKGLHDRAEVSLYLGVHLRYEAFDGFGFDGVNVFYRHKKRRCSIGGRLHVAWLFSDDLNVFESDVG